MIDTDILDSYELCYRMDFVKEIRNCMFLNMPNMQKGL